MKFTEKQFAKMSDYELDERHYALQDILAVLKSYKHVYREKEALPRTIARLLEQATNEMLRRRDEWAAGR
jgi:hypothetical protein